MKPTRIPTLFAQIMGLVLASLVATAVVGITAILVMPQQADMFILQDAVNALNAGKSFTAENGKVLAVVVKDLPPVAADTDLTDYRSSQYDWIASQITRPDLNAQGNETVRLYSRPQRSLARTLLERLNGFGDGGRGGRGGPGGPGGRGGPGGQAGSGQGDRGGGPPPGLAGGRNSGSTPSGQAPSGGPGPPGGGGGFRGATTLAADMVATLTPMMKTDEEKKAMSTFRDRLNAQVRNRNFTFGSYQLGPDFKLAVQRDDGKWQTVQAKRTLSLYSGQIRSLGVLLISIALVSPFAWLLARRLSSPLVAFAAAAERLGRDPRSPPLELRGSAEVRAAVIAFNEMQEKLRRYVEDRTAMVAAIAHDLRTPLTRVRFRVDTLPDDIRPKLEADIDQMDEMISSTLAFARDAAMPNQRVKLDLTSLVQTVFDQAEETGAPVKLKGNAGKHVVVEGDPLSLKRLFTNLVDNAVKYGKRANGRMVIENGVAVIEIEDEGPGIPEAELQKVFEPFYRRESSRNRETGGTGLGLAVVRSIALAHGGDVVLQNRAKGGLIARVTLPV